MNKKRNVVAIVGRPNVGKSTLFNRLARRRKAIVNNKPGVTRDRIYHKITLPDGKIANLVDTGGLEPTTDDYILSQMKTQTLKGVEEADVIVMMVDGSAGLTAMDEEVADVLRRSGKPVIVAVNKVDLKGAKDNIVDFYSLGFEHYTTISAEHGTGVEDLLEIISQYLEEVEDTEEISDDEIRISIIGKPNVGKSSLLNRIIGEERALVSDLAGTTRDAIDVVFKYNGKTYRIVDTAGIRKKKKVKDFVEKVSVILAQKNILRSDVVLMLIDSTGDPTLLDANIAGFAHNNYKNVIVVFNKWDLVEKDTDTVKEYEKALRQRMKFLDYAPVVFISAKTGQRVKRLFKIIDEIMEQATKEIKTSELNRFLEEVSRKHKAPPVRKKPFKMYYITQTGVLPQTFTIFTNSEFPPHFSYHRYLENQLRERFSLKNVPIKLIFTKKPGREKGRK